MALSGTISGSYRGWTVRSVWSATQSVSGNYSDITVNHYLDLASGYNLNIGSRSNSCTVNGTTQNFTSGSINQRGGTVHLGTTSYRVGHNNDGTKSCSLKTTFNIQATLSGVYTSSIVAEGTISLNTIPRAATISKATNFNDTGNPTITYSNSAGNSVTSLKAGIFLDGFTAVANYRDISKTGTSYTFNLTDTERNAIRAAMPNSNTLSLRFYVQTVLGGQTYLNYTTATVTIVDGNPTFTAAYKDTNSSVVAVTQNDQLIVQNKSTLQVNITNASAKKSATLTTATCVLNGTTYSGNISGSSYSFNIGALDISSNATATVTVADSRGNTTSTNLTIQMIAYYAPSAIITTERQNNFYSPTTVNVDADYASVDGKNSIQIKVRYKKTTTSTWSSYVTFQDNVSQTLTLDNDYAWDLQTVITDLYSTVTYNTVVSRGMPIVYFDRLKNSVGFNCFPLDDDSVEAGNVPLIRNILTYSLNADITSLTTNAYTKAAMTTASATGTRLTANNGDIVVGAGVSKLLVSAQVAFTATSTAGVRHIRIIKNNTVTSSGTMAWMKATIPAGANYILTLPPVLINVSENDTISLYYNTPKSDDQINGTTTGAMTFLTADVVG